MKSKYQSFACVGTWHLIIYVEEKNKILMGEIWLESVIEDVIGF